jgi:uncharacterized protein (DUF2225 family)
LDINVKLDLSKIDELNETAQSTAQAALALQQLQKQNEAQQMQDVLNPPQMLHPQQQQQRQNNYNYINPGLAPAPAPRPGR